MATPSTVTGASPCLTQCVSKVPSPSGLLPHISRPIPGLRVRRAEQGWEEAVPGSEPQSRMMSVVFRWRVTGSASRRMGW